MAIVRDETNSGGARRHGAPAAQAPPKDANLAALKFIGACDGPDEFPLPLALDPHQPDYLPRANIETHIVEVRAGRMQDGEWRGRIGLMNESLRRKLLCERPTHDQIDDFRG
jgi:hypothetical protein